MYMGFVISLGLSEAEIVKPLNVYKEMERSRHNFFQSWDEPSVHMRTA